MTLEETLESIIRRAVAEASEAARSAAHADLVPVIEGIVAQLKGGRASKPAALPTNGHSAYPPLQAIIDDARAEEAKAARKSRKKNGEAPVRKPSRRPTHCIAEDCTESHGGPKTSYMCKSHMGLSKAKKGTLLAGWKAAHASA